MHQLRRGFGSSGACGELGALCWPSMLALLLAVGCASSDHPLSPYLGGMPDSGSAGPAFSEIELAVIRGELGSLAEKPTPDPSNQFSDNDDAARLGQAFFFESRYSPRGNLLCATCHDPKTGFQDARANTSQGIEFSTRQAPSLINTAYGSGVAGATVWQFWDGRKDSLWSQALAPVENPAEMGSSRTKIALLIYDKYRAAYEALFGPLPQLRDGAGRALAPETARPGTSEWEAFPDAIKDQITQVYVNFGKAVAAYEAKIVSRRSRYDAFCDDLAAGATDSEQLSSSEKQGLRLFVGKGRCVSCHLGPNLSDWKFHVTGAMQTGSHVPPEDTGRETGIVEVKVDEFNCMSRWSDRPDKSNCAVNALSADDSSALGAFKTPGLRSVSTGAPYFHTGALATLTDLINFYDRGGDVSGFSGTLDSNITPLDLSDAEKQQLLDFLNALDGQDLDATLIESPSLPP